MFVLYIKCLFLYNLNTCKIMSELNMSILYSLNYGLFQNRKCNIAAYFLSEENKFSLGFSGSVFCQAKILFFKFSTIDMLVSFKSVFS